MNTRVVIFVSISIALHLGVLSLLSIKTPTKLDIYSNDGHGSLLLNLNIIRKETPQHETKEEQITDKKTATTNTAELVSTPHLAKTKSKSKSNHATTLEKTTGLVPTKIDSELDHKPDHVKVNQILREELSRHFHYPVVARKKNWQGKVLIEFTITSNGDITQLHISASSGYEVLDNAAMDAINRIRADDKLTPALNGQNVVITLPITYQLISS